MKIEIEIKTDFESEKALVDNETKIINELRELFDQYCTAISEMTSCIFEPASVDVATGDLVNINPYPVTFPDHFKTADLPNNRSVLADTTGYHIRCVAEE